MPAEMSDKQATLLKSAVEVYEHSGSALLVLGKHSSIVRALAARGYVTFTTDRTPDRWSRGQNNYHVTATEAGREAVQS